MATTATKRSSGKSSTPPTSDKSPARAPREGGASKSDVPVEFGGRAGALGLMVFSHFILYYMYYCINLNGGALFLPLSWGQVVAAWNTLLPTITPTASSIWVYLSFLFVEGIFAVVLPGITILGRADDQGKRLAYDCNAYLSWYASLLVMVGLEVYGRVSGVPMLASLPDMLGQLMTTAVVFSDILSVLLYVSAFALNLTFRMSGDPIYDFFMGAILHPRLGRFDLKFWAEIRISWFILFGITASCAIKQYATLHFVSPSMLFMVLAHFLYANACAKGEHYVPPTWDIFYEKFGWMLCFWNFAGVPFLYCAQSVYILNQSLQEGVTYPQSQTFIVGLTVVLLAAYYFWDSAQAQKNHFRLQCSGVHITRNTFPQMPWSVLSDPKFIKTQCGTPLLTDGWWAYARKIHYTADIVMALSWGLACGFSHFLPYFYVIFFTGMIVHRNGRDIARCSAKYGRDWDKYCETVPYTFIPGVY